MVYPMVRDTKYSILSYIYILYIYIYVILFFHDIPMIFPSYQIDPWVNSNFDPLGQVKDQQGSEAGFTWG